MAEENAKSHDSYDTVFARELARPLGLELAERVSKDVPDVTADMARVDAIARSAVVRALKGDNAAVKYLFESGRRQQAKDSEIPFIVEHVVVDDEV